MPRSAATFEFFRDLLARDPANAAVRADLAAALLGAGAEEEAVEAASAALAAAPDLLGARLTRAEANRRLHRPAEAIGDLRHAARLAPGRAAVAQALGAALAATDHLTEAETALTRAAALAPGDAAIAVSLGSVLLRQGKFAPAEAACRRALAADPALSEAHRNMAALLAGRDPDAARAHRDAGYRERQVFVEAAPAPDLTVLVPSAAGTGNVPTRYLFPAATTSVIRWYVEYATADQDRTLPRHDLIFNAIGDPDEAPDLPPAAARLFAAPSAPVLNPPDRVARTGRAELPALLAGIPGIVVPEAVRAIAADPPAALLPALVRPLGAHGGEGVRRVETAAQLAAALAVIDRAYVTRFVDTRDGDGFYRKYRAIFVDRVPYAYHLAISPDWLVHYWTAGMAGDGARRAEEARFLADPGAVLGAAALAALGAIGARLDLDFAGIDFARPADGRLVVFEANATMLVHPEDDPVFAYRNESVARILAAFAALCARRRRAPRDRISRISPPGS